MPNVIVSPIGGAGYQFFDNNGNVLSGGKLYTYAAGTSTPATTYSDAAGTTPNTNPIVLGAAGRVPSNGTWLVYGTDYKFVLKTAADVTVGTWDGLPGSAVYQSVADVQANLTAIANCFVSAIRSTSSQTLTKVTYNKLQFNNEISDTGNNYNTGTYEFTAPVAGNYLISAGCPVTPVSMPVVPCYVEIYVFRNGASSNIIARHNMVTASLLSVYLYGSIPMKLAAGDKITIQAYPNSSVNWTFDPTGLASYLNIARIS